jgi:PAS domain S-box-containing protein
MAENTPQKPGGTQKEDPVSLSILIVEDEVIVANDLKDTLLDFGYTVAGTERTGEGALAAIQKNPPGLVLMDIHLDGKLDGVETADVIHRCYGIPVIYLTAYADSALLERAKFTEPYGYIIKPYQDRELLSVIEMAHFKHVMDQKLKESEESLRKLNEELEARVADRTASLQQQLVFLQQLIDTIPAPVYYKDSRGTYLGCNNAFESYCGIPKRQIVGKTDKALFSSDIAVLSEIKDSQLITRRGIQVYQAKFPHADHKPRDVIIKKATFDDADGRIAGFIGVMLDISDRIQSEDALAESEARFRSIAEDLLELVYRSKPDHTCVFANQAFLAYFNRTSLNTVGFQFTPAVHPGDTSRVQQHLAALTKERPAASVTCRILHPDGSVRNLYWITRAFFDSDGHVREYQYTGHEIGSAGLN